MAIKYKWLAGTLRDLIKKDVKNEINKLPSEQELCRRYHVSRQTVRQALNLLTQEGLIEKRHGSGSYITGHSSNLSDDQIDILISDDSNYIYPGVLNDIQGTLRKNRFSSQVHITKNETYEERKILTKLLSAPPRGIIVEGSRSYLPNPNLDLYRALQKKNCRFVFLHNYYQNFSQIPFVKDDNVSGSRQLTEYLLSQGHTAIGGIFHSDDLQGAERFQGFMETMRNQGLPVPDSRVGWFNSRDLDHLQRFQDTGFLKKFVQDSLESCTAVVCYNDMIAYFLIKELNLAGYHLPDDMAIGAFDNTYLSNSQILTLTTLSHKSHEMGTAAANMMIQQLKGIPVTFLDVPWTLIPKGSTPDNLLDNL